VRLKVINCQPNESSYNNNNSKKGQQQLNV